MKMFKHTCPRCSNVFETRFKHQKYCSYKCAATDRRLKFGYPTFSGKKHTTEHKIAMSVNRMKDKNPNWKGENVSYGGLHCRIRAHSNIPELCQSCKKEKAYDAANISGNYLHDLSDWEFLCRRCHMLKDGRLQRLNAGR